MRIFFKYFYQITMTLIFIFIAENSYGALNGPTWETAIRPGADTSRTSSLVVVLSIMMHSNDQQELRLAKMVKKFL